MSEAIIPKELENELKAIRADLNYIKENMVDVDTILTKEDERALDESLKEHKEGKTTPLEELKRKNA